MTDHHPVHDPGHLRARARDLRNLADTIERTPAMTLDTHAGPDTWRTPRADLCRWILGSNQAQVRRAADDLRWSARRLEQRAAELDALRGATAAATGSATDVAGSHLAGGAWGGVS